MDLVNQVSNQIMRLRQSAGSEIMHHDGNDSRLPFIAKETHARTPPPTMHTGQSDDGGDL